ncbi:TPA: hypothetical protein DCW54_00275 [Candidatus Dependentiae bacterium]|nr:hypothetical protein [Candidatus Dependentiae bacterium]
MKNFKWLFALFIGVLPAAKSQAGQEGLKKLPIKTVLKSLEDCRPALRKACSVTTPTEEWSAKGSAYSLFQAYVDKIKRQEEEKKAKQVALAMAITQKKALESLLNSPNLYHDYGVYFACPPKRKQADKK